jgi:hypothetical protein
MLYSLVHRAKELMCFHTPERKLLSPMAWRCWRQQCAELGVLPWIDALSPKLIRCDAYMDKQIIHALRL